jgi:hypothetical protein
VVGSIIVSASRECVLSGELKILGSIKSMQTMTQGSDTLL